MQMVYLLEAAFARAAACNLGLVGIRHCQRRPVRTSRYEGKETRAAIAGWWRYVGTLSEQSSQWALVAVNFRSDQSKTSAALKTGTWHHVDWLCVTRVRRLAVGQPSSSRPTQL